VELTVIYCGERPNLIKCHVQFTIFFLRKTTPHVLTARNADRYNSHGRSVCPSVSPSRSGVLSYMIVRSKHLQLTVTALSVTESQIMSTAL